jgi:hypothetical protein
MGGQRHAPTALPQERPGTNCIGGRVGHRTGTENLATTGIRSPDRPAHSEPLYRLSSPGPKLNALMSENKDTCCAHRHTLQLNSVPSIGKYLKTL